MKAATAAAKTYADAQDISIHAAREGGDLYLIEFFLLWIISIHAAREGGDMLFSPILPKMRISIHAAREGGDF